MYNISTYKVGQQLRCITLESPYVATYDPYFQSMKMVVGELYTVTEVNRKSNDRCIKTNAGIWWVPDHYFEPVIEPLTRANVKSGDRVRMVATTSNDPNYPMGILERNIERNDIAIGGCYTIQDIPNNQSWCRLAEAKSAHYLPLDLFVREPAVATAGLDVATPSAPIGPSAKEILAMLLKLPDPKLAPLDASKGLADIIDELTLKTTPPSC